jgi:hypothetical protein
MFIAVRTYTNVFPVPDLLCIRRSIPTLVARGIEASYKYNNILSKPIFIKLEWEKLSRSKAGHKLGLEKDARIRHVVNLGPDFRAT